MPSYFIPLLSTHLTQENYSPIFNGGILIIAAFFSALSMPFVLKMLKVMPKRVVMYIGFIVSVIAFMIMGLDSMVGKSRTYFTVIGAIIFGVGYIILCIPVMPELIESIEKDAESNGYKFDEELLNNRASSYFVICMSLGESSGPFCQAMINRHYSFT